MQERKRGCGRPEGGAAAAPGAALVGAIETGLHVKAKEHMVLKSVCSARVHRCCPSYMAEATGLTIGLILVPAGMGVPTVTAARILKGQLSGQSGEETQLEMDKFPFVSLAKVCPLLLSHCCHECLSRRWLTASTRVLSGPFHIEALQT